MMLLKLKIFIEIYVKNIIQTLFADNRANDIISALTKLYDKAIKVIETGTWEKSNFIAIKTTKGTTLNINYLYHWVFELGEYYVCNQHIIYIFDFNKKVL